ncbi:hypothetical protein [Seonamhaeicola sp.]|uniref:hypothetical protein n=1 Tax=Seonamhaeicola sp. TaxID=1912245 RepID=UPI00262F721D|nr:hypothetical protein [Seonamhaeicola sp.]
MKINELIVIIFFLGTFPGISQSSTYVDDEGVFRWVKDHSEIRLFGANYTLPFAHGFRAINYIGEDHKKAIDDDVYHMARLGLDAFRIHVWDAEISDVQGNLIPSAQLDLLDYTLFKMKERGFKTIVTPFKVGDNGYPEKPFPAPGFSAALSKPETYSDETILLKQERYFTQFLNHINPYTGIAYKNDPDIIALEINNEPQHDHGEIATKYINRMVEVIRRTGFENPIFYNVSERSEFIDAYCKANIQGCTFQWYPTGLVYNKELKGNYLPNVDVYNIPFKDNKDFKNKARAIYEFDPADVATSYLYPAMARSFREAKFQFAAQFAYEPLALSYANTEYQTHYLNLVYTPSKAISLMIASQIFHEMSGGQSFGRYPQNKKFGNTRLDTDRDISEYNSHDKFYYTNSTESEPVAVSEIKHIAGVGTSSVVKYSGTGAYFLDKIDSGIWRLEVLPDVLWVNDPFKKPSLSKAVAVIKWNEQWMDINIEDLGADFSIVPLNDGNTYEPNASLTQFNVVPGTYLLRKKDADKEIKSSQVLRGIQLNEYVAPRENIDRVYVVHQPEKKEVENRDIQLTAKVVAPNKISKVEVVWPSGYHKTANYEMSKKDAFTYSVSIPKEQIKGGTFSYYIVVHTDKKPITFPNTIEGSPEDWDFISEDKYEIQIVNNDPVVVLFDANENIENTIWPRQWKAVNYKGRITSGKFLSDKKLSLYIDDLNAEIPDMTFKIWIGDKIKKWQEMVMGTNKLIVTGSSGDKEIQKVQIALQLTNGNVFGKIVEMKNTPKPIEVKFNELQKVPQVLLPRPYPVFQPYWFESNDEGQFDASKIEALQISVGPGIPTENHSENQQLELQKIYLE